MVAVLLENDTRGKVRLPALHIAAKKDDTKVRPVTKNNQFHVGLWIRIRMDPHSFPLMDPDPGGKNGT